MIQIQVMRLINLKLTTFRNIESLNLSLPLPESHGQILALIGPNGAGKTSILEALSLLSPGRGIHKATPKEMIQNGTSTFGIFAELDSDATIGVGIESAKQKIRINGTDATRQTDLAALGNVLWLTPRQDRLFLDGPAPRRDLIDRLTFGLIASHAEAVSRYKHHTKNRLKLLATNAAEDWLALEERQAAEAGVTLLKNRQTYLAELQPYLCDISLSQKGATLDILKEEDPITALFGKFERSRERDTITGSTNAGPMKVDITGELLLNDFTVPLAQASSGQHKRSLIDLTLAHAKLIKEKKGHAPLILLDEFTAHLDPKRQKELLEQLTETLLSLGAQIWLTDVDSHAYKDLPHLHVIEMKSGQAIKN